MVYIYMNKEELIEQAINKLQEVMEKELNAIPPEKKALLSIELEDLYNRLAPYRSGSLVVEIIADDCLQLKYQLTMCETEISEDAHALFH